MEIRDLIVAPIVLVFLYFAAFLLRPYVTDSFTKRYFFPALTLRIVGALGVGFIYQFYYSGGDTFYYHAGGSRFIWEAFNESPYLGLRLFLNDHFATGGSYYISRITYFDDPSAFVIIQISSLFDLLTFSSYAGTAIMFAILSFIGSWLMFLTFYKMYPKLGRWFAYAIFFIPSVLFWGSGILKDTITFAVVGSTLYSSYYLFIRKEISVIKIMLLMLSVFILYKVKIYILLTFIPSVILWVFFENVSLIRNKILRGFAAPLALVFAGGLAIYAGLKAGEDNQKYSYNNIAKTAQITAYDLRYYTGKDAGSGYSLGELDGTLGSMFKLAPKAIATSLFRPYLWEVNNPLMLLSALESFAMLVLLVVVLRRSLFFLPSILPNPTIIFCLVFSLIFAFAVGVSTYNFGSLVRYKIPMMPFFVIALILINDETKKLLAKSRGPAT